MKELEKVISDIVQEHKHGGSNKLVRFSIGFRTMENRRLEFLSKTLNISKQELISKLVTAALFDLEDSMGYIAHDNKDPDIKAFNPFYWSMMTSDKPIEHFIEEEEKSNRLP